MLGLDNIKACFATRDIESCLWALFDVASALIPAKKIVDVIEAIYKVVSRVAKFFDAAEAGARALKRLNGIVEKARKNGGKLPSFCPIPGKSKSAASFAAFSATPGTGSSRALSAAADPVKPPCLTKVGFNPKTWKAHWTSKKPMMEKLLGKKYPKWKDDEGAELLNDWFEMIRDGRFEFKGIATIKKDHDPGLIFRYNGHTLVLQMDGTFWTFLQDGGGMNPNDFQWLSGGM
ncbi:hypothetical protein [Streptomyces sp. NPDC058701]|uniref:hypothetical protein n=1 Tax=Streptomyces sp. NPDC058701 TaxID=3346608 RepID=UPI00365BFC83